MPDSWWRDLYLDPNSSWVDRHHWLDTGTYFYELRPPGVAGRQCVGKFKWHNRLVEDLNFPNVPSQHDVARALAKTTLARQCDRDPETGLSKCSTGLLLLAAHLESQDVRCRVMEGCGVYLAFHRDDITSPEGEEFVPRVLEIVRLLNEDLRRPPETVSVFEPESRIYR